MSLQLELAEETLHCCFSVRPRKSQVHAQTIRLDMDCVHVVRILCQHTPLSPPHWVVLFSSPLPSQQLERNANPWMGSDRTQEWNIVELFPDLG